MILRFFRHKIIRYGLVCIGVLLFLTGVINWYIVSYAHPYIYTDMQLIEGTADAGIVLGAKVYSDGRLSRAVKERADGAIALRKAGKIRTILVSGDNRTRRYDEVTAIKKYLFVQGIPPAVVFLDYAGLDTYDSMYRAQYIFGITRMIIPTQQFHVARSVYIARNKGIEADGLVVSQYTLPQLQRLEIRERFARFKAWVDVFFDLLPYHLGDPVPITGKSNSLE